MAQCLKIVKIFETLGYKGKISQQLAWLVCAFNKERNSSEYCEYCCTSMTKVENTTSAAQDSGLLGAGAS